MTQAVSHHHRITDLNNKLLNAISGLVLAAAFIASATSTANAEVVAQYSFEEKLDDTAPGGGTADDLSYIQGTSASPVPTYMAGVPGLGGFAAVFDGNYFTAADSADLDIDGDTWTIEAFVSVGTLNGEWERLILKWSPDLDYHFAIRNNNFDFFNGAGGAFAENFQANTVTATDFSDGNWHHLAVTSSAAGSQAWIDGESVFSGAAITLDSSADAFALGDSAAGPGAGFRHNGRMDEVLIHDSAVDQAYIDARAALLVGVDSDADGLPDVWEQQIIAAAASEDPPLVLTLADVKGPDDAPDTSDYDQDGATDADEFAIGTDPIDPDTDDDGLADGNETATGIWNGPDDTGTDPLLADSDGDNLGDAVEDPTEAFVDANQPGTDPNNGDTDGDGFGDGAETAIGSDPTDPDVHPDSIVVARWSFEDNLNDTAPAGLAADHLTDNAGGVTFVPGVVGKAVVITRAPGGTNKLTAPSSADLNLVGDWTMEAYIWRDTDNLQGDEWERFWTKWGEGGTEYHWSIRGRDTETIPDGLDLFANNLPVFDHDATSPADVATIPYETWTYIALVGDESGSNTITGWVNGVQVVSVPYVVVVPTAGNMNFGNFAEGDQSPLQFSGYIDEALIHDGAVSAAYLQSRARLLLGETLRILSIEHQRGSGSATITWSSISGRSYAVDWSADLGTWFELDDGIVGEDGETSFEDESVPPDAGRRYYRVREFAQ